MSPRKFITRKELASNPPVVLAGEPGEGAGGAVRGAVWGSRGCRGAGRGREVKLWGQGLLGEGKVGPH